MRILDENGNEVFDPDLSVGELRVETTIKEGSTPIDNVGKFAWDDDDYEEVLRYIVLTETERARRVVEECKAKLENTDYIAAKAIDAILRSKSVSDIISVVKAMFDEYGEVLDSREEWRSKVSECEAVLNKEGDLA